MSHIVLFCLVFVIGSSVAQLIFRAVAVVRVQRCRSFFSHFTHFRTNPSYQYIWVLLIYPPAGALLALCYSIGTRHAFDALPSFSGASLLLFFAASLAAMTLASIIGFAVGMSTLRERGGLIPVRGLPDFIQRREAAAILKAEWEDELRLLKYGWNPIRNWKDDDDYLGALGFNIACSLTYSVAAAITFACVSS